MRLKRNKDYKTLYFHTKSKIFKEIKNSLYTKELLMEGPLSLTTSLLFF